MFCLPSCSLQSFQNHLTGNYHTVDFDLKVFSNCSLARSASSGPPLRPNTASISSMHLYRLSRGFQYMTIYPFSSTTNLVKFQGIFLILPVDVLWKHYVFFRSFLKIGCAVSPFTSIFYITGNVAPILTLANSMISSLVTAS